MSGKNLGAFSRRIREIYTKSPEQVFINVHHIESERKYREISIADVQRVLRIGKAVHVKEVEHTVVFEGIALDGRIIRLYCTLLDEKGEETLIVEDAECVEVGTAFEHGKDDDLLKKEWLKTHPDYEDAGKKFGVQKKL